MIKKSKDGMILNVRILGFFCGARGVEGFLGFWWNLIFDLSGIFLGVYCIIII